MRSAAVLRYEQILVFSGKSLCSRAKVMAVCLQCVRRICRRKILSDKAEKVSAKNFMGERFSAAKTRRENFAVKFVQSIFELPNSRSLRSNSGRLRCVGPFGRGFSFTVSDSPACPYFRKKRESARAILHRGTLFLAFRSPVESLALLEEIPSHVRRSPLLLSSVQDEEGGRRCTRRLMASEPSQPKTTKGDKSL
jgi:hypothetical protein